MKRINKVIYDKRPGYKKIVLYTEHFCGCCGKRISRFARKCPACRVEVEV